MQKRWGPHVLRNDPCYSPDLSLVAEDFSLAWPPCPCIFRFPPAKPEPFGMTPQVVVGPCPFGQR